MRLLTLNLYRGKDLRRDVAPISSRRPAPNQTEMGAGQALGGSVRHGLDVAANAVVIRAHTTLQRIERPGS